MGKPNFYVLQTVKGGRWRKCSRGLQGELMPGVICVTVEIKSMFSENIAKRENVNDKKGVVT